MVQILLLGLGAGAAAALLFASVATGSLIATLLFYLAPLPIMIATLGWSHWAGLLATLTAAVALGAFLGFYFFTGFLFGVGLPAWWLGYLALLARPLSAPNGGAFDWYPVGRLVLWAALIGAALIIVAIFTFATDKDTFQSALRGAFERALRVPGTGTATGMDSVNPSERERLINIMVAIIPPAAAVLATLLNVLNLWLAARIVKVSGRLRRPWPELPALVLPPVAPVLLAGALAGTFLPDILGLFSGVLAASLMAAFAILGFAVLHAITLGMNHRRLALGGTYASVIVLGWPVLVVSLLGFADAAFSLRQRFAQKRGPPPSLRT